MGKIKATKRKRICEFILEDEVGVYQVNNVNKRIPSRKRDM